MHKQTMKCDPEGDALILMNTARIVREDIFQSKVFHFNGSFPSYCQQELLPTTLKSLVTMLLRGADLINQDLETPKHVSLSHKLFCLTVRRLRRVTRVQRFDIPWNMNHPYSSTLA